LVLTLGAGLAEVEAKIECDLIIARAPGVEFLANIAGDLDHPTLHRGVHVLVRLVELKRLVRCVREELLEGVGDLRMLIVGEETDVLQHGDMRDRATNIDRQQAPIIP
jgi:hypothetical protein